MRRHKQSSFEAARSAGEAFLGFEISWDIGDRADSVSIPRVHFNQMFARAGRAIPEKPPSAAASLPLACRIGWGRAINVDSRLISVKEQSRPDKGTPLAFAVYHRISKEGEQDDWQIGARVRIEGDRAMVRPPAAGEASPIAMQWAEKCAEFANNRREYAYNADVSEALVSCGNELGWVSRRSAGGVYFLPGMLGERFMRLLDELEAAASGQFYGHATPQFADPRTLKTWAQRTTNYFDQSLSTLIDQLEDMTSRENVRTSTFDLRAGECLKLADRAKAYTDVLRDKLDPLLVKIDEMRTQFEEARAKNVLAKTKADKAFAENAALVA